MSLYGKSLLWKTFWICRKTECMIIQMCVCVCVRARVNSLHIAEGVH
jgi:hypothetical protein